MAADLPPYMNAYGNIERILNKVKDAATPAKFTQDYLTGELGYSGGSALSFIPFAKRLGLIASDGTPTELYKRFRNSNKAESGRAIAAAMKHGYQTLYKRHEYLHSLSKEDLTGIVAEVTGLEKDSKSLNAIVQSFLTLKKFADFSSGAEVAVEKPPVAPPPAPGGEAQRATGLNGGIGLSYTINLILPNTTEIAVFDAIFKSLRENML
jgi:Family of unknown function (DUF5343)